MHSEILLPEGAPQWMADRQRLWNQVEAGERRKDAQLARELEIGLPLELTHGENVAARARLREDALVSKGMVADLSIHEDDANNPHAHVLLTMREVIAEGFGRKVRAWNAKGDLLQWREAWAEKAERASGAGRARHPHRSSHAGGAEHGARALEENRWWGQERQADGKLPRHIAERMPRQEQIARENGEAIIEDPRLALRALTHHSATFTERDIARFLHTRTLGRSSFRRRC